MSSTALFIVEGKKDEPRLIRRVWKALGEGGPPGEFYVYNTNIHMLVELLFDGTDDIDEDLDVQKVLRERETDASKVELLKRRFTDVYLVFDLDPQDKKMHGMEDKIRRMLDFFSESTNHGKMYINYPMVEAFRHIKDANGNGFDKLKVPLEDCLSYKKIVGEESYIKDPSHLTDEDVLRIIGFHLKKANLTLSGRYETPKEEDFFEWRGSEILGVQLSLLDRESKVYVLNTCVFSAVEYRPSRFLYEP